MLGVVGSVEAATVNSTFSMNITSGGHNIYFADTTTSYPYDEVVGATIMQTKTFSFVAQTSSDTSFGTTTNALYWENTDPGSTSYTITLAADDPTTIFSSGQSGANGMDFNDATANTNDNDRSNDDGADGDTAPGQMTIDASTGTITRVVGSNNSNINPGSSTSFEQGVTDSVTLIDASSATQTSWAGYITGMTVAERMAEQQLPDTYTFEMTVTMT